MIKNNLYEKDGKKYRRVTEVISIIDHDIDYLKRTAAAMLQEAADRGTAFHAYMQALVTGKVKPGMYEGLRMRYKSHIEILNRFIAFWYSYPGAEVVEIEQTVYDDTLLYAGTPDLLFKHDGTMYLIDWKSCELKLNHKIQIAAYWKPLTKKYGKIVPVIVAKNKKKFIVKNPATYYNTFLNILSVYNTIKNEDS